MKVECLLCESFSERIDQKGKYIISFKLKKNLSFTDKEPFKASSVKRAWKLFTEADQIKSIFRFAFGHIKNVRLVSDYEVELVYDSYAPDHLSNLVLFKILKLGKKNSHAFDELIGIADYTYKEVSPLRVFLESKKSSLPNLDFKVVKDETTLALKLMNKEIDLSLVNMSPRKIDWLRSNQDNLKFFETEGTIYNYLALNHQRFPTSERKFRKALSLLIPRKKIQKHKLKGAATLAKTMFSDAFPELSVDVEIDPYDPLQAKKLFKELGFKERRGVWFYKDAPVELEWKVSNNKATVEMVKLLKNEFEKAGLKINLTLLEWGTFMSSFKRADFDILMSRWVGFTGPEMLNYVFSSDSIPPKGANRGHFKNVEIDELLEKGKKTWERSERLATYKEALKKIDKEYPYISLWYPRIIWIGSKCIEHLKPYPNESFRAFFDIESRCE